MPRVSAPLLTFPVRTLLSLPRVGAPVPKKTATTSYPWVFRPDLPEYREFHISLKTTDRVYLALKKIENLEKIPAEQLILCALLAPVAASTAPKAETPGDQNDSKVVEATAKDVAAGAQTEANDNEEKTAQDNTAELEKEAVGTDSANSNPQVAEEAPALVALDNPNRTLASYGLQEKSIFFFTVRSLADHPQFAQKKGDEEK
eukprot:INCI2381.1.p1 GENE.INCI2381.1~~INCI2381.1.p1  ORF type:complete len:203 (-),score=50.34 INCI2381.1:142-750(-)